MSSDANPPLGTIPPPPPPPPAPQPVTQTVIVRPRRSAWGWLAVGCGLLALLGLLLMFLLPVLAVFSGSGQFDLASGRGNIAIVEINGMIHSGPGGGGLFGFEPGASEPIMKQLRDAAEDDGIKAVVLDIDSPGGTPGGSQAIAVEVRRLAEKKPVVAAMGDTGASGAYYIASQARQIVANPSTLTGSIGVRMQVLQFYDLMKRYGVSGQEITSGDFKDTGSPFRPMRPDEKVLLESLVQDTYNQFVADVAKGRKLPVAKVRALADGRVFTGNQALKAGLVDKLGNFHDAIQVAADLAGIKGKPSTRRLGRVTGFEALFNASSYLQARSRFPYGYSSAPPAELIYGAGHPELTWGQR